jgi:glycosyltransferase involved in cell wall biosynthesis
LAIASLFGKEDIIGQHHGGSWPFKHLKESKKKRWFFPFFALSQFWENRVLKNIKLFYALSPQEIDYLKKRAKNSKIRFQTMGIDDFYFSPMKKEAARKKLGWPLDKKIVVNLGRMTHIKGIKYLIDAMKELPEVDLKVIGYGPQLEEFKEYTKSKKIKNVEFLGAIFGKNKLPYLSAADAFILPSSREGASVSVMEALARNVPIVTTDIAGMPLMIKDEKEGYVVPQRNSSEIAKAVKKILKWENRNIKKSAEQYKWKRIVDETVKDYEEI